MFSGTITSSQKLAKGNVYTFTINAPYVGWFPSTNDVHSKLNNLLMGFANVLGVDRGAFSSDYIVNLVPLVEGYTGEYWGQTLTFVFKQMAEEKALTGLFEYPTVKTITGIPMVEYEKQIGQTIPGAIGSTVGTAAAEAIKATMKPLIPILLVVVGSYLLFRSAERKVME